MKNKAKLLSVILTLALLICTFPVTASAADYEPADGDTLDISACAGGDVITIGCKAVFKRVKKDYLLLSVYVKSTEFK